MNDYDSDYDKSLNFDGIVSDRLYPTQGGQLQEAPVPSTPFAENSVQYMHERYATKADVENLSLTMASLAESMGAIIALQESQRALLTNLLSTLKLIRVQFEQGEKSEF